MGQPGSAAFFEVVHRDHIWVFGVEMSQSIRVVDPAGRAHIFAIDIERAVPDVYSASIRFFPQVRDDVRM